MNILIACEESQRICLAYRAKGQNAFSCDLEPCSGGAPEYHIQNDVLKYINGNCSFKTMDNKEHYIHGNWDLLIAHPPCTYLAVSGNAWFNEEKYGEKAIERKKLREEAVEFFMKFVNADCQRIAIENPVGIMSTRYKKPTQYIQPYQFGHPVSKKTGLWLKNLPKLIPTNIVEPQKIKNEYSSDVYYIRDENGKLLKFSDPRVQKERSKTYKGIAEAIASQWLFE